MEDLCEIFARVDIPTTVEIEEDEPSIESDIAERRKFCQQTTNLWRHGETLRTRRLPKSTV